MIQSIDELGNVEWQCQHVGEDADRPCGAVQSHHISHEHIRWHGSPLMKAEQHTVSLPPCSVCGAQTFLKVHFTEKELKAPNMWQAWNDDCAQQLANLQAIYNAQADLFETEQGGTVARDVLLYQINQLEAAKQAGGYYLPSHAVAQRHMQLREQLIASGKIPQEGGQ